MRLAVFGSDGGPRLGLVGGGELVDITTQTTAGDLRDAGPGGPLHELIARGGLDRLRRDGRPPAGRTGRRVPLAEARLLAPLLRPGKIIGAPVNYRDHAAEMSAPLDISSLGLFLKAPSSVAPPGGAVRLPYTDLRTDQEAELAVVIGRLARDVPADRALDVVAGYLCAFDMTVRSTEDRSTRKSFDTFTPLGPWLVTPDEVGDPAELSLRCWVNDAPRQSASTADLIFGVPELIAYASAVMTLWPGDVILTGTPAGVGPVRDGDRLAMEISRIGRLELTVDGSRARPYAARPGAAASSPAAAG